MAELSVRLSDELTKWVAKKSRDLDRDDASAYVRLLISEAYEREVKIKNLQALVDEGLKSGISEMTMEEIFDRALRRYKAKQHGDLPAE